MAAGYSSGALTLSPQALAEEPRPSGCRKLSGTERDYRIRVGEHRVLYEILDETREVRIYRVGHRRDVYR